MRNSPGSSGSMRPIAGGSDSPSSSACAATRAHRSSRSSSDASATIRPPSLRRRSRKSATSPDCGWRRRSAISGFRAERESPIQRARRAQEIGMPLHYCHPTAPHKKLRVPEWYVSGLMMDRALDAIVRRVKKVDREHDIPYLAGYSRDGKTIYIDRHMPKSFRFRGRVIETDRFLILHEEVEKTLINRLNLHYLHAHQIATRAEQAAVRAAGVNWRDYDRFMQKYVKKLGDERLTRVPADLDEKPYRDEHDYDLLRRMEAAMVGANKPPAGVKAAHVRHAIKQLETHLQEKKRPERKPRARR